MVHRTPMSRDKVFLLQSLRRQIGQEIFPIHRLDRPTSGVILFGKSGEASGRIQKQLQVGEVQKTYIALVRGWFCPENLLKKKGVKVLGSRVECTSDLKKLDEDNKATPELQNAQTFFEVLQKVEIPLEYRSFKSIRYSLLSIEPHTGRTHQIRRHLAHLRHPIVGDTRYGDLRHNAIFKDHFDFHRLWLHASSLEFMHPYSGVPMCIKSEMKEGMWKFVKEGAFCE